MKVSGERLTLNAGMYPELEWEHLHRYKAIAELVRGKTVLDAACGTGYGSQIIGETAQKVYGIDISSEAVEYAKIHSSAENVSFFQMSVTDIQFDERFDVIVSFETIEHINEQQQNEFLERVTRYLKEDGLFIVSTPDREILTELIAHDYQNPFHMKEFSCAEFEAFLKKRFRWVYFYYQNLLETSVISSPNAAKENNDIYQTDDKVGKYIIAICSQNPPVIKDISGVFVPDVKKYYLEKYLGAVASLFIDTGSGYNEEEKIVQQYIIEKNTFSVAFDLSSYAAIKALRFDPCEFPCKIEITGLKANVGGLSLKPANAFCFSEEWYLFTTINPFFELQGAKIPQVCTLEISGNIEILPYAEAELENFTKIYEYENRLADLAAEKNAMEEQLKQELESQREVLDALNLENENLKYEYGRINEALDTKQTYIQELEIQNAERRNELCAQKEQYEHLTCELSESVRLLQNQCQELETQICQSEEYAEELRENLNVSEQENSSSRQLIEQNSSTLAERERHIHYLEQYLFDIQHSTSWRITAPVRCVKNTITAVFNKRNIRLGIRKLYLLFPIPFSVKKKFKDLLFTIFTPFIKNTETYKIWVHRNDAPELSLSDTAGQMQLGMNAPDVIACDDRYIQQIMSIPFGRGTSPEYVEDITSLSPLSIKNGDIKYLAFYLPQFHPFPENDEWWGKGFTEWTNVTKAVPQFAGHYQPRLAGELGYYDLRNSDILKAQMELAKRYGVYGFCIYYYWFDGKTLMDAPLKTITANPELDLPFCLCWANENWSRRWDGKENDILIAQNYDNDFPMKFIRDISVYMRDSRYIRLEGKPILVIYNANQIPKLRETIRIWREAIRANGLGELHLLAVDFALTPESKKAGFDGFIEFPPHSVYTYSMLPMNSDISFINGRCGSQIYDYQQIVREKKYLKQDIENYYKGICTAWDNTARKPYSATVYHNYSVSAFREWLKDISALTVEKHKAEDRFVFINAWNEWAEGTYLEPDGKFGYANLKAVRDTLVSVRSEQRKIIYVGHDAWFNGAQLLSLNIIRQLKETFSYEVYTILISGGVLKKQFEAYSDKLVCLETDLKKPEELIEWLKNTKAKKALCNTVVSGNLVKLLSLQGIECVSMIHEMENVIHQYKCEEKLQNICNYAKKIVFASDYVKKSVEHVHTLPIDKIVIQPQGMYKLNLLLHEKELYRRKLREQYSLPFDAKIALGVGYGDARKGIDLFLKVALEAHKSMTDIYFMWVGNLDHEMKGDLDAFIKVNHLVDHVIFAGSQSDVMPFYTAADIFLLTSREDPFPTVVMEAMDSELPVIAFEGGGGYVENILPDTGRIVPMEDYVSMAEKTMEYMQNDRLRQEHGAAARRMVEKKYNFINYIYALLDLLDEHFAKVSAVVPNYNYARYLGKRLNSILSQTYPISEIIVLDDASTDGSMTVLREYQEKYPLRIWPVINAQNSGNVFLQWARGLHEASGEYVWIAEADDLATPDMIERLLAKMSECEHAVMAYAQSYMMDENGLITASNYWCYTDDVDAVDWHHDYIMDNQQEIIKHLSVKNTIPNVSAVLFKNQDFSEAIEKAKHFSVAGDWAFYVEVLRQKGEICFVSDSLNYHRRHSNSVTTALKAQTHFDEICEMQDLVCSMYPENVDVEKVYNYRKVVREILNVPEVEER